MKVLINFFLEIYKGRQILVQLVRRDITQTYLGTNLGIIWAFAGPMIWVLTMSYVFENGLRATPMNDIPLIVWMMPSYAIWNYVSTTLVSLTSVYIEYSYLVKKVNFKLYLLPLVKIISGLIIHSFFLILVTIVLVIQGVSINIYWTQVLYYLFSTVALLLAISWIVSSIAVFIRDITQIITAIIQVGLWLTPVFWSVENMPENMKFIIRLNPFTYLVEGYRKSFITKTGFWIDSAWGLYFWAVTLILFYFGFMIYRKLRPQFADVL